MKKILREGKLPEEKPPKEMTCTKCGTLFSYEEEDMVTDKQALSPFYYVICPYCQKQCRIGEVPLH